jgi:type IV secretory pathway TraG/TraD family ATPase VirD4
MGRDVDPQLLHGTAGLALGYGAAWAALVLTMIQRQASWRLLLLSPLLALPCVLVGALLISVMVSVLGTSTTPASPWLQAVLGIAVLVFTGFAGGLLASRQRVTGDAHKRGTMVRPAGRAKAPREGAVTLGGVEIPALDETKHFKLVGTTGSGKSTAIRELLTGALQRGDRAIIADPDGGYLSRFYDQYRGDVILNPFDERSAQWDLFGEIEAPHDVEQLARSLICDTADPSSREWRAYARTFLAAILEYCKLENQHDLGELWRLIAIADAEELRDLLAGTAAQPFLAEGAMKMLHSIRGTATPALAGLKYAKNAKGAPLSIRQWVREGRGVLFLPYRADQIASLRDLIATWLRLAIFETMSRPEGDQHLWFIIDELDALGAIDGLKDALARLRKFGGRCVLGFQSVAQVRGTYGDAEAQTIIENCGNSLILRSSASERGGTAEFASRLIGKREVIRQHVSHSRPTRVGGVMRQTRTIGESPVTEDAVMASEIEQLPDLAGFLKVASQPEWQRIQLRIPEKSP